MNKQSLIAALEALKTYQHALTMLYGNYIIPHKLYNN